MDNCAAEFEDYTYYYSTYETGESEAQTSDRRKVMILGGRPIGVLEGIFLKWLAPSFPTPFFVHP